MASRNDFFATGTQDLEYTFEGGLDNSRSQLYIEPPALIEALNARFDEGSTAVFKELKSREMLDTIGMGASAIGAQDPYGIAYIQFENRSDIVLYQLIYPYVGVGDDNGTNKFLWSSEIWWCDTSTSPTAAQIIASLKHYDAFTPVQFIKRHNTIYLVAGSSEGRTQAVRSDRDGGMESAPWGIGPSTLEFECEWFLGKPFHSQASITTWSPSTSKADLIFRVAKTTPGVAKTAEYDHHLPKNAVGGVGDSPWMFSGPNAVNREGGNDVFQPGYGHVWHARINDQPLSGNERAFETVDGDMIYDVWITEYDEVNDLETGYSGDIEPYEYQPRVYNADDQAYWTGNTTGADMANDDAARPHRLLGYTRGKRVIGFDNPRQPEFNAPSTATSTYQPTPNKIEDTSTTYYGLGGYVLRLKIDLDNLKSTTTHLRIYKSRKNGAWPEGGRVPNAHVFMCYERSTGTTVDSSDPHDGTNSAVFINMPDNEPGVPIGDINVTINGGSVWTTPPSTINIEDSNGDAYLFLLIPYETMAAIGAPRFPVVETVLAGELVSINPRNVPPPKATMGALFQDQLVLNDLDNAGFVRWCFPGELDYFPPELHYDMDDFVTGITRAGRYVYLGSQNRLILARFLPTDNLDDDQLEEAFVPVDEVRGPAAKNCMVTFMHPGIGAAVAFMDIKGNLWMSNGATPQLVQPRFSLAPFIENGKTTQMFLVNNPFKFRLELYYEDATFIDNPTDDTASISEETVVYDIKHATHMFSFNYHITKVQQGGFLPVLGPYELDERIGDISHGPTQSWSSSRDIFTLINHTLRREFIDVDKTKTFRVKTGVINPRGVGKDFQTHKLRVLHGPTAANTSKIKVNAYRDGRDKGKIKEATLAEVEGITQTNVDAQTEGIQISIETTDELHVDGIALEVNQGGEADG